MAGGSGPVCAIKLDAGAARTARAADLYFSTDCVPGIRREGSAGAFRYVRDDGEAVEPGEAARIEALGIPPAWRDVWICGDDRGHLQATGRDARGRKQYRYHERWREVRDASKYERLVEFGEALPKIRARVDADLRRPKVDREQVLALVVAVLDRTFVRVGNAEYARENESFGLTTLRGEHADVTATRVTLRFRGKAGRELEFRVEDPRVARAFRRIQELPGQELFEYVDAAGRVRWVESGDVNDYLRQAAGADVTSKDFRTWGGSLAAALVLAGADDGGGRGGAEGGERVVARAIRAAAEVLRNTPAVAKRLYVHPGLVELYRDGRFGEQWRKAWAASARASGDAQRLDREERAFLALARGLAG